LSVIVSDKKAIRPEQRKLFPSDYFSRNFSLMIISLNCRIFTPASISKVTVLEMIKRIIPSRSKKCDNDRPAKNI